MSLRTRLLPVLGAVALVAVLALAPAAPASADAGVCTGLGGSWDAPTTTCTLAPATYTLGSAPTFTGNVVVGPFGATFNGPGPLTVTGNLIIQGSTTINDIPVVVGGTTTIEGPSGGLTIAAAGTFDGSITTVLGSLDNAGTITGDVTHNAPGGHFASNSGTIHGTFASSVGAATNSGVVDGAASVSGGTLTNSSTGSITTVGVSGTGSLVNDGTISAGGVTFAGTGTFTGSGTTVPAYPQTVAFSSAAPSAPGLGSTYLTSITTSSVGTAATLVAGPVGVCSIAVDTVTFDGIGTCTITAARPANGNFAAATASQSVVVPAAGGGGGALPATGAVGGPELLVGAGLLVLGGGILLMRRLQAVRS
jgi:fibronectin-binding autotransporter adhesin